MHVVSLAVNSENDDKLVSKNDVGSMWLCWRQIHQNLCSPWVVERPAYLLSCLQGRWKRGQRAAATAAAAEDAGSGRGGGSGSSPDTDAALAAELPQPMRSLRGRTVSTTPTEVRPHAARPSQDGRTHQGRCC